MGIHLVLGKGMGLVSGMGPSLIVLKKAVEWEEALGSPTRKRMGTKLVESEELVEE